MPSDFELEQVRKAARAKLFGDDPSPARIGRYRIERKLGAGGMGIVYAARDDDLDREVAVKLLLGAEQGEGSTGQARLLREARSMAKLSHPNVVHVYEVGKEGDQVYIAMEYIRGMTLRSWAAEGRSWREVVELYIGAGRGLQAAHDAGIVHRDFKPENVLVAHDGRPRVLDFGLARPDSPVGGSGELAQADTVEMQTPAAPLELSLTRTGALLGTPAYMAPEQFKGQTVDARSDQYSFCAALFESLYEERPFSGNSLIELSADVLKGEIREIEPSDYGVPAQIHATVLRGLSRDPGQRFESMDGLLGALDVASKPAQPKPSSRGWLLPALGAAGLVGAVALSYALDPAPGAQDETTAPEAEAEPDPWAEIVAASNLVETLPEPLPDDPLGVTVHRLRNGLTVYVAPMREQPRIMTNIIVHAGSRNEEEGATGVAHLLEHMMFKGTTQLGTVDWEAEKPLLDKRDALAKQLAATTDPSKRASLLAEIGEVATEAAQYVVPMESSNVLDLLGAELVNGFTQREALTFVADIPSARLETWAELEAERLRDPIFRGFFSELPIIEDELSRTYQADVAVNRTLFELLYEGTQDAHLTIGEPEDLARPPLAEMQEFYRQYFVPNNISIVLAGDVDAERALSALETHFGDWAPAAVPDPPPRPLPLQGGRTERQVPGDWAVSFICAWRVPPPGTDEYRRLEGLTWVLGEQGGLLDEHLVDAGLATIAAFGLSGDTVAFYGRPAPGRTHAQLEADLMDVLERVSSGALEPTLADRHQAELDGHLAFSERTRASWVLDYSAQYRQPWPEALQGFMSARKPEPDNVAAAARDLVGWHRYVLTQSGEPYRPPSYDIPRIPPVEYAPGGRSERARELLDAPAVQLEPQFVVEGRNYRLEGDAVIVEKSSEFFELTLSFDVGRRADPLLCTALRVWLSAPPPGVELDVWDQRGREAGVNKQTWCSSRTSTVTITGLSRLREPAMKWLQRAYDDAQITEALVERNRDALVQMTRASTEPSNVGYTLEGYALHGDRSFERLGPGEKRLAKVSAAELQQVLERLRRARPRVEYYGPEVELPTFGARDAAEPEPIEPLRLQRRDEPRVLVLHDATRKQAAVHVLYPAEPLGRGEGLMRDLLEAYLSGGMASLLFTELREKRSLGYAVYAEFEAGILADDDTFVRVTAPTAPGRVAETVQAAMEVLGRPVDSERFEQARVQVDQSYRSSRIAARDIPGQVDRWRRRGYDTDPRLGNWARLPSVKQADFAEFYTAAFESAPVIAIVGDTSKMDLDALAALGVVERVELSDIVR